jgi:Glycosyl transferase family 2
MVLRVLKEGPTSDAMAVICPVRNEMAMLPHFLDHYRRLGMERFIFIDNGSIDGGQDYLCVQPDCRVYHTDQNYRESNFATSWINEIIERDGIEGWLLYADVDEHLIFPGCESKRLPTYCEGLTRRGFDAAYAIMLDMYPADDFLNMKLSKDIPLAQAMPWFDTDYVIRTWPKRPWTPRTAKHAPQILGGPRCRLQTSLEREVGRGWLDYLLFNQVDRFVDYVPLQLIPALARLWPVEVPALQKTPLNFVRSGFRYWNSHTATNEAFSDELLVFLHFKFCAELQARFQMVQAQANHVRRGLHYLQLQQALQRWNGSLLYEGSAKFQSSDDLARPGLLGNAASHVWMLSNTSLHRFGTASN